MASFRSGTVTLLVAGIALTAAPSFAQRRGHRNGGEDGRRDGIERVQRRGGGEVRGRAEAQARAEPRQRVEPRAPVVPRGRVESYRGQGNRTYENRAYDNRSFGNRSPNVRSRGRVEPYRGYDNRRYDNRVYGNRGYDNRSFGNRAYNWGRYGGRPYSNRSYVVPYGYRPYGYRPGWSLNLYFGRPYSGYVYPAYGYPSAAYGYYSFAPGRAYGAIRIVNVAPDAQVFVDGYYAGVADGYDGVFQHLNLEAGVHHIEIEEPGYPPIAFDVRIEPGRTITYRANR